jgi:hypothetical protein
VEIDAPPGSTLNANQQPSLLMERCSPNNAISLSISFFGICPMYLVKKATGAGVRGWPEVLGEAV